MVSLMGFFFTRSSSFFSGRGLEGRVCGVIFDEELSIFLSNYFPFSFSIFFIKKELKFCLSSWIYLG